PFIISFSIRLYLIHFLYTIISKKFIKNINAICIQSNVKCKYIVIIGGYNDCLIGIISQAFKYITTYASILSKYTNQYSLCFTFILFCISCIPIPLTLSFSLSVNFCSNIYLPNLT